MTKQSIKLAIRINNLAIAIGKLSDDSLQELEEIIKDNQGMIASVDTISELVQEES